MNKSEKEVIILVYYISIRGLSIEEINDFLWETHERFEEIDWPDDVHVKTMLVPVNDQKSRIDCVYPINMNKKENKAYQALEDASIRMEEYLKNAISSNNITDES